MSATDKHKCDMYCLWEDLDSRYKKCKNCIHSRESHAYPQKNNQVEIPLMKGEDNPHLWRHMDELDYNEYKKWLESKYNEVC